MKIVYIKEAKIWNSNFNIAKLNTVATFQFAAAEIFSIKTMFFKVSFEVYRFRGLQNSP